MSSTATITPAPVAPSAPRGWPQLLASLRRVFRRSAATPVARPADRWLEGIGPFEIDARDESLTQAEIEVLK